MKHINLSSIPAQGVSHNPEIQKRVMLQNGFLPHLTTFAQATFAPNQQTTLHSHADMAEVFFVESGEGIILVEGVERPLTPGTCVAIEAGEQHQLTNNGKTPLVLTYFGIEVS
ncbi:MAG: cupin domain-containing protein [Chloroflexi bacterium]|nr:MAG: cupin domain-containing protein [Chloroflexota bacterium]